MKKGYSQSGRTKSLSESWTTNTGIDLYGEQSGVKVEIGDDQLTERKTAMKECPEWMQFSTITSAEHLPSVQQPSSSETWSTSQSSTDVQRDEKIKAELLVYEKSKSSFNQPPQDESSNSEDDEDSVPAATNQQVDDNSSESESESETDHFTMILGGTVYALNDITEELIAKMTDEEKQTYTSLCREAYDDLF